MEISALETMVQSSPSNPILAMSLSFFFESDNAAQMIKLWSAKDRTMGDSDREGTPSKKRRLNDDKPEKSSIQLVNCRERDGSDCVLTSTETYEVAYIYPRSLGKKPEDTKSDFWQTLTMFWTKDKVDAWKAQVLDNGTEVCQNHICLSPDAHRQWDNGNFALKYKDEAPDKTWLCVKFHWLPIRSSSDFTSAEQVPERFRSEASYAYNIDGTRVASLLKFIDVNEETCRPMRSGDIVLLKTHNPVTHPLPSKELLEMQWILHRVRALRGAADTDSEMGMELASGWDSESATPEEEEDEEEEEEEEEP